ncbi:MAG: hypothetical protein GXP13_01145 [Gammaproteobacteria bacterium]|nr:hypothetical protein [Gammaproteobacteria bacterium]
MILDVFVDQQAIKIEVPDNMLKDAGEFFNKIDSDMDKGWKMGPTYIENPDQMMRAQIVADKMLTAIDTENKPLIQLMAAYILTRVPGVKSVNIDIDGDPLNTEILL